MTPYIIKTLPKYAKPECRDGAATNPYYGNFHWCSSQKDARRFESRDAAQKLIDGFCGFNNEFGIRVVRLKPRKK